MCADHGIESIHWQARMAFYFRISDTPLRLYECVYTSHTHSPQYRDRSIDRRIDTARVLQEANQRKAEEEEK